jgi:hypothetical protein
MRDTANSFLIKGHIVIFDTMQTYFSGGRSSILPPAATNSFRLYLYPVRTTLMCDNDCARHDMTVESQLRASGPFSVLSPFSNAMKGNKHQATSLSQLKIVSAATSPSNVLYTQSPHYHLTLSTCTREGQQLPNHLLFYLLDKISLCRTLTTAMTTGDQDQTTATQNMNLAELLETLESQFNQNHSVSEETPSRVELIGLFKKWFDDNQYTMTLPLYGLYQRSRYCYERKAGNVEEAMTIQSKLSPEMLPSDEEISLASLPDLLKAMKQLERLTYSCLVIKYKDGINRQWSAPWNIQSRSPICLYLQNHWKVMSAMPRGPEVAGDQEHGVTALQDVDVDNDESYAHFAPHYQTIIKTLKGVPDEEAKISRIICSSKRDGMCFRVLSFLSSSPECTFWQQALKFIHDPFVELFVNTSRKLMNGSLLIPASNGTAFLTHKGVQYWMVCSIALSYGITHQNLLIAAKNMTSPADLLLFPLPNHRRGGGRTRFQDQRTDNSSSQEGSVTLIEAFVLDIIEADQSLSQHLLLNKMHTWEAIGGPNRMCAFDPLPHVELACSYTEDQCGISYLGYSVTTTAGDLEWIPHFEILHSFSEPVYWLMDSVTQCRAALGELSQVFSGNCNWEEFYSRHPPMNRDLAMTSYPDPEGFVSYFQMKNFKSSSALAAGAQGDEHDRRPGPGSYVYCKTKTWMYYVMHKIRIRDIPSILLMPEQFGQAFPSFYQIKAFFGEEGIRNMIEMITRLCEFVETSEELKADIPSKAAQALSKPNQSQEIVFKILLCNSRAVWRHGSVQIASKYFKEFLGGADQEGRGGVDSDFDEEGSLLLKSLLMDMQCYRPHWEENVHREFDFAKISESRRLSDVAGRFWSFLHSK